jgi:hypothetical protein
VRGFAVLPLLSLLALTACDDWARPFRPQGEHWQKVPVARTPMPPTAYRVEWDGSAIPREMQADTESIVRLSFTNRGDEVWPDPLAGDPDKRDGSYAVRLGCQWLGAANDPSRKPDRRIELPRPVRPGETMTLLVNVKAPSQPGEYQLEFELVQELVVWFDAQGGDKLLVPVVVKK